MAIIANNIIIGDGNIEKVIEPKLSPVKRVEPIVPNQKEKAPIASNHLKMKFKEELKHGLMFGHDCPKSTYLNDMFSTDKD